MPARVRDRHRAGTTRVADHVLGCDARQGQQTGEHSFAGIGELQALVARIGCESGKGPLHVGQHHPDIFGKLITYALRRHRQCTQGLSDGAGALTIKEDRAELRHHLDP